MPGSRLAWGLPLLLGAGAIVWLALQPDDPRPVAEGPPVREFVRGNSADPESLDPLQARSEPALNILRDLHEGLTTLDARGRVVPGAARSWTVSADGLAWRFELDPAARWSDGRAVTAQDFVTAFAALADPAIASPQRALFGAVAGVAAEGEEVVVIELEQPTPWLDELLAHPAAGPRRQDVPADGRVSSGAFRLVERVPGSHLIAERNPAYRAAAMVALDQVRYLSLSDQASELSRYRAGEIDMTYTVPVARVPWLQENLPGELRISPYLAVYFYGFNTRRPPLDDPRVRRALSLAIDRDLVAGRVVGAGELPACNLVPPGIPGYASPPDPLCKQRRSERLERARALLAEAGYGPERPLRLEIRYNSGEVHDRVAVAVSAFWREGLGIETDLVREEFRVLLGNVRAGEVTQVYRGSWIADFAQPDSFLGILAADSPVNGTGWSDPEFDRLLRAAAAAPPDERARLLAQAEALLVEAAPLMPLYFYVSKKLVKPWVSGIEDNPLNVHPSRFVSVRRP
ncbi:peptide ABC transporter substrate-binding protein [Thioalkalivibrio sp. XN8]|uniref:peptide ABC transporter substrate-binding protein n=1 Tax=Thioalkalivibrio sp. XN8 TaxID=2712863 RepID=UPI0013EC84CB|nr:peptide ABC transporter substrate-binding protein [Thioalkalivibrio sp. XN8]NGP52092.1 peptide ABC transporter substrate-binding protein [Thioalkalivibrio sp. XN8]